MQNLISIVVPTYKNPECLEWLIKSFNENIDEEYVRETGNIVELIIVIDGHVEMYNELFDNCPPSENITIYTCTDNVGFAKATNIGSYIANGHVLVHMNDDNVLPWDYNSIMYGLINTEVGVYDINRCCISLNQIEKSPSMFDFVVHDFGTPTTFDMKSYVDLEDVKYKEPITNVYPKGAIYPFMISKLNYMKVGGLDEGYESPFIVDWDFFLKLELMGCKFYRTKAINLYHFGSMSTKNGPEASQFKIGEQVAYSRFKQKWGFEPYIDNQTHSHLPKYVPKYISPVEVKS